MSAENPRFYLVRIASAAKRGAIEQNKRPSFFLLTLASLIKQQSLGELRLVDTRFSTPSAEDLSASDVFIVETDQFHLKEAEQFFKKALGLNPEAQYFFIGQGPTAVPGFFQKLLEHTSKGFVIRGEPEEIVMEILNKKQKPDSVDAHRIHQSKNFASFPPMIFSNEQLKNYQYIFPIKLNKEISWGHVIATRGCPHTCSFCTNLIRESYGVNFRTKNISTLIEELKLLKSQGVNVIAFADDDLTASPVYLNQLCEELITQKIELKWSAHARVDECTPELLQKMKRAGCSLLRFGIESGSVKILKYFNKTRKPESWALQTQSVIRTCKEVDIQTVGLFIIGAPFEEWSDIKQTLKLIFSNPFDLIQLHIFTPFQDTIESKKLKITEVIKQSYYNPNAGNFSPLGKTKIRLIYIAIYCCFYLNPYKIFSTFKNYGGFFWKNQKTFWVLVKSLLGLFSLSTAETRNEI